MWLWQKLLCTVYVCDQFLRPVPRCRELHECVCDWLCLNTKVWWRASVALNWATIAIDRAEHKHHYSHQTLPIAGDHTVVVLQIRSVGNGFCSGTRWTNGGSWKKSMFRQKTEPSASHSLQRQVCIRSGEPKECIMSTMYWNGKPTNKQQFRRGESVLVLWCGTNG